MDKGLIQAIESAIKRYKQKTSAILELGYIKGSMYRSRSGNGYLQWYIRIDGEKHYVRNSEVKATKAACHRWQHLQRFEKELVEAISIAIQRNQETRT